MAFDRRPGLGMQNWIAAFCHSVSKRAQLNMGYMFEAKEKHGSSLGYMLMISSLLSAEA
jgi:hypothetical protein